MAITDQQIAASLRRIEAVLGAAVGSRELKTIVDHSFEPQEISHKTITGYKKLIVNVYALVARAEELTEAKPSKPASKSAALTLSVRMPLPGGASYQVAVGTITKAGVTSIDLDLCPNAFDLVIEVDGDAEYAVFGI
jgi:hypothetical protein